MGHAEKSVLGDNHVSKDTIPESVDRAMDQANPPVANGAPGISIRNGPMDEMDVDASELNQHGNKRRARSSMTNGKSYKEASDEDNDDEEPLVRFLGT